MHFLELKYKFNSGALGPPHEVPMFQAPNYTQIPNIIFDELMPKMKEAELRIFMIICRHTIGWHVREKVFSLTFFQNLTGMSKQGVLNGIKCLEDKKLITKRKITLEIGHTYSFSINIDHSKEMITDVNEIDYPGQLSRLGGSQQSVLDPVNEVDPYKERRIKKEEGEKEKERGASASKESASASPSSQKKSLKIQSEEKKSFGEFGNVKLTQEEYDKAVTKYGEIPVKRNLEALDLWIGRGQAKGERNHYLTLLTFIKREKLPTPSVISKPSNAFQPKVAGTGAYDNLF